LFWLVIYIGAFSMSLGSVANFRVETI
jgi:hypothetical protein